MSDYSKITNFLSKDSLSLNDPAKYVKGSEIDAEYNAIAVAVATKANTDSPTLTTPVLGVATATSLQAIIGNVTPAAGTFTALTATGAFTSLGLDDNATAKALTLSGSGANSVTIANSAGNPTIGVSGGSLALSSVINYIGTGSADFFALYGGTEAATIQSTGASTDVALQVLSKGAGSITLAAGALTQVVVLPTASADRYITLTGSAGGNPIIDTSAGMLKLRGAGGASPVFIEANITATPAHATGLGLFIGDNLSAGSGEVNFYNAFYTASQSFDFRQISASGVSASVLKLLPVAGMDRNVTITGSNGGNPTIGTSAGSLAISANIVAVGSILSDSYIQAGASTAIPAGGSVTCALYATSSAIGFFVGSGAPSYAAVDGSLYLRTDGGAGTTLYQRRVGAWVATAA